MPRKDLSTLREEAIAAVGRGKLDKALELYGELEQREPAAPAWPKRLGETHRRAGQAKAAVAAFERAVDKYVQSGFLVQAIAVCKLILQIDPAQSTTAARLAELAGPKPTPREPVVAPPVAARAPAPAAVTLSPGAGLDSIDLSAVVTGARRVSNPDGTLSGTTVLPIEPPFEELELVDDPVPFELAPATAPEPSPVASDRAARLALVTTPLFAQLPPRVLEQLITRMGLLHLEPGDVLFREGDAGACLYVISEGEVVVEAAGVELARLGPSAFFGEVALVTDLQRSATIRAVTRVELLAIDRDVVRAAAAERPEIVSVLLGFVRDRLVDRITRTSELFRPFSDRERTAMSAKFEFLEVAADTMLIVQGERADGLYIVVAGRCEVRRTGEPAALAMLASGDVFGEMSLLAGGGSTANVRAASRVLALRMPARTFREVIMTHPTVLAYLGDLADRRSPAAEPAEFADLHLDML